MFWPICRLAFTFECFSACASVLMQMNSTPSMPADHVRDRVAAAAADADDLDDGPGLLSVCKYEHLLLSDDV